MAAHWEDIYGLWNFVWANKNSLCLEFFKLNNSTVISFFGTVLYQGVIDIVE